MNGEMHPEEIAFHARVNAVFLRKTKISFEEVVKQYRDIETEFVERAGDIEYRIVETKRRITEWLLSEALRTKQPHEVCRAIWEELLERGFSDINLEESMSSNYVRCCRRNGEFDVGIEVLDRRIAVLEKMLEDPELIPTGRPFCEENIALDKRIRDELKAGLRK